MCGLIPEQAHYAQAERDLDHVHEAPPPHFTPQDGLESKHHDRIIIYTDGACRRNAHKRLRRAGCGGFWGQGHAMNFSMPLPGRSQTNQRAELLAALKVCEAEPRHIEIRSDSAYVCKGFHAPASWRLNPSRVNADLWKRVQSILAPNPDRIMVSKVKGHASWSDVAQGRVDFHDKVGNAEADKLACQGADSHASVSRMHAASEERRTLARRFHKHVLGILKERLSLLSQLPELITGPPTGQNFARNVRRRLL